MANLPISRLDAADNPTGDELLATVQSGTTKKIRINQIVNYITPTNLDFSTGDTVNLSDSDYDETEFIRLHWVGATGTATLNLPDATENTNRLIRFISNGGFTVSTRVELTPISGQTLDGSTSPYVINKEFEGIQVWTDGVEWFIIQKKA